MVVPGEQIKVLVVEDQPKILKNQLKLLEGFNDIRVVGSAMSGEAALDIIPKLRPDLVLLDLGLPGMSGIEVTKKIKSTYRDIEILIFTIFDDEEKVIDAVRVGASGYLLKGMHAERIVDAIKEVCSGGSVIQPHLARCLLRQFRMAEQILQEDIPILTDRETEILTILAKGLSNREIASVLGISKATIRTHLEHIYEKLDVTNRVEAVTEGIKKGIIEI